MSAAGAGSKPTYGEAGLPRRASLSTPAVASVLQVARSSCRVRRVHTRCEKIMSYVPITLTERDDLVPAVMRLVADLDEVPDAGAEAVPDSEPIWSVADLARHYAGPRAGRQADFLNALEAKAPDGWLTTSDLEAVTTMSLEKVRGVS